MAVLSRIRSAAAPWIFNPILLKELRGTLRTRRFFWAFFLPQLLLAVIFAGLSFQGAVSEADSPEHTGKALFQACVWTLAGAVVLILPAFSCTALASERERRTFELLETTRMTPGAIVWGKFSAAMLYAGLFLTAALPLVQIGFLFGGVSPKEVLGAYLGLAALAAAVTALALGISAPFKGTRWPALLSYLSSALAAWPVCLFLSGFLDRSLSSYLLWELPAASLTLVTVFCLLLARRFVQHPSEDRSLAFRIFFVSAMPLLGALVLHGASLSSGWTVEDVAMLVLGAFVTLLPWILAFACEEPFGTARARAGAKRWSQRPFLRLLAPGSARGGAFIFLTGALFLTAFQAAAWRFLAVHPPSLQQALDLWAFGLSLLLLCCGAGSLLATCTRPGMARALLFIALGLFSAIPVCAHVLRDFHADGERPPQAWLLPFLSPGLAWYSLVDSFRGSVVPWTWWWGLALHHWAMLGFSAGGIACWGIAALRRRDRRGGAA